MAKWGEAMQGVGSRASAASYQLLQRQRLLLSVLHSPRPGYLCQRSSFIAGDKPAVNSTFTPQP